MDKLLSITFLSYNDSISLFSTIKQFIDNTNNLTNVTINVLVQKCSKSYIKSIENLCVEYNKRLSTKFVLHTEENNLGVSKANNLLYNITKQYKYVLHIEDDWILNTTNKEWLKICIEFLETHDNVSTIALRGYGSEKEKEQYGWNRNIPYQCHQNLNFNYSEKLGEIHTEFYEDNNSFKTLEFKQIKEFLFTFNPVIRRNKDYLDKGVYPLPEFEDKDELIEYNQNVKIHKNDKWGWCEALTMEKTRDCITYMFEDGIFYHFDDNKEMCLKNRLGIYKNDFDYYYNINSHYPVLAIHIDNDKINPTNCKHEFLCFIHYIWNTSIDKDEHLKNIEKILINIKPKVICTIGDINKLGYILSKYFTFEYRKRWINYSKIEDLVINQVEYCAFNNFKHEQRFNNPLVSVITPAYESKHRIYRPYKSLLGQTYTNWEWIIIDDSKSDNTWKTLIELAESDHRIKIYKRHKNNGSIGENKLFCSSVSQGAFIFELDHDDDIMPQTFDRLIGASKKYPDADFFYSDCVELGEDTLDTFHYGEYFGLGFGSYYRMWYKNDFHYVYKTHRVNPNTQIHIVGVPNHFRCWTKRCYNELGGHNKDLPVVDDYDLIVRTINKYKWCHIPELLYLQYRNSGGDNSTFHRNALIQYLVSQVRNTHEEDKHKRFVELGVNDDTYNTFKNSPLDYEIDYFQYPILDYVYVDNDTINEPLMSVVIPTYNRVDHLRRALDSVFSQTYQNFEILLVGDKCPVLNNFVYTYDKAKDSRFKWFNLSKNGGAGGHLPRNYAIKKMCNSKWITYLDDDNEWLPNHLEVIVKTIKENEDISYIVNSMIVENKEILFDELRRGRIDTSTTAHKFELCVKNGLWKDRIKGGYSHDFEFFSRIFNGEKGVFTKVATLKYNTEFNSQSYESIMSL